MSEQANKVPVAEIKPKFLPKPRDWDRVIIRAILISVSISFFSVVGKILNIAFATKDYNLALEIVSTIGWQLVFLFAAISIGLALKVASFFTSK